MSMKCKRIILFLLCLLSLIFAVSCRAAPPAAEVEPPVISPRDIPPEERELSALEAAAARAAQTRNIAYMLDGAELFPSEWEAAQSLFEQAQQQRDTSSLEATRQSMTRYDMTAVTFEAMAERAAAIAFELTLEDLQAAREAAIAANALLHTPDLLLHADNTAERGIQEYEAGNFYAAINFLLDADTMYNTLIAVLYANNVRAEIFARGFEDYDPLNVERGIGALLDTVQNFTDGNYQTARDNAETALSLFTQALNTAWTTITTRAATAAAEQRQRALDYRANIAVRPEFDSAETVYNRANTALRGQDFEYAVELFVECTDMFIIVAQTALERRLAAEEALRRADERVAESEEIATYADEILEGYMEGA